MSITLIDTNVDLAITMIFQNNNNSMSYKDGYVHPFSWFEILSKKMCINCGLKENA